MKKELLAPAGDMKCLKAAINNGADAVYLAGKSFGARKFANNFSLEELKEATNYAHLYEVKIYVTVNTIIYEDEMDECLKYIEYLYNIGVDALIVQDIGLINLIRKYFPDMEIHASTQAHTHNIEQIKLLESLGVKRVVLARELSLEEINNLDTNMELEIFIHGALCISYSGQCLLSSGVIGRSGNRGECAGLCRCPYNLLEENKKIMSDKYLLSPKEFNTICHIKELINSNAYSFKIEGRMKSLEYVGYVTKIYRTLLNNPDYQLSREEIFNLKSLYNRGFTDGYLFNNKDQDFISLNSSNHLGVKVGEVVGVNKDKIKIKLSHRIKQGDAVRLPNNEGMYVNFLYDNKMMLVSSATAGEIVYIDNKVDLNNMGDVSLTINSKLIEELNKTPEKKIGVKCTIVALNGKNLSVSYSDGKHLVKYDGDIISLAKNSPISKDRIEKIMGELGNTPFRLKEIDSKIDSNIFIPIGVLKEIRRNLVLELCNERVKVDRHIKLKLENRGGARTNKDKCSISALARNKEQVEVLLKLGIEDIYVTSLELYRLYKNKVILQTMRVNNDFPAYSKERLLIGETGSLKYSYNNLIYTDYYLNVVNLGYIDYLNSLGVKRITLSPELTSDRIINLANKTDADLEVIVYGTLEYMIMKYNLIKNMKLDNSKNYYLEDKSKRKFLVYRDNYTHLLSNKKIDIIDNIANLKEAGVKVFRLELCDETEEEIEKIIGKIKKML